MCICTWFFFNQRIDIKTATLPICFGRVVILCFCLVVRCVCHCENKLAAAHKLFVGDVASVESNAVESDAFNVNVLFALIDSGDFDSISDVANQTGFGDPLYFSRMFKKSTNLSPANYRFNEKA